jgi:hypothetical protein
MIVECPHCYTRVIPIENDTCPSCHKNVLEIKNIKQHLTSIAIKESSALPKYCCQCNLPTNRFVTVKESVKTGDVNLLLRLMVFIFSPILILFTEGDNRRSMKVKMPQCSQCARKSGLKPLHVDFENYQMTFVVHKEFRERVSVAIRSQNS